MQDLVSLLEQTWARVVTLLNSEVLSAIWADAMNLLSDGTVREALGVGLAVFVAVMLIGKRLSRSQRDEADLLRERLREVELKLEAARGEVATAKRVQNDLQKGDPEVFASALATAIAENGPAAGDGSPVAWLDPLRPALADAYLKMARDVLGKVQGEDDLARARALALGAVAAEPERKECADLLARIDEAERMGLFSELSEADALAWRIARSEAEAMDEQETRGLVTRSRGQIGYSILLSGWEADELHASAIAELADHGLATTLEADAVGEGAASQDKTERRGKAGGKSRATDSAKKGGQVVALTDGASVQESSQVEEAQEETEQEEAEQMRAAAGGGRGSMVLVMPSLRGGGRGVVSKTTGGGHGGPGAGHDTDVDRSEREAEFRRLWERRRRPEMLGESHPRTLAARANMAYEAGRQGRHEEAEEIFREVIEAMAGSDAPGDHQVEGLSVRHNLAMELLRQGKLDEAEAEFREILGVLGTPGGRERSIPLAFAAAHGMGEVWSARGNHGEAKKAFDAVWRARQKDEAFGPDHPHTLWSRVRMLREAAEVEG